MPPSPIIDSSSNRPRTTLPTSTAVVSSLRSSASGRVPARIMVASEMASAAGPPRAPALLTSSLATGRRSAGLFEARASYEFILLALEGSIARTLRQSVSASGQRPASALSLRWYCRQYAATAGRFKAAAFSHDQLRQREDLNTALGRGAG